MAGKKCERISPASEDFFNRGLVVEEEGVKSALELAMERVSSLPELTPEELAAQKIREYAPLGEALGQKYLNGYVNESEMVDELNRYGQEQRSIVLRALAGALIRTMSLDAEKSWIAKAVLGIAALLPEQGAVIERGADLHRAIQREYEREQSKRAPQFETLALERLSRLGVSGSAIAVNLGEDEQWRKVSSGIRKTYEPRLQDLRARLLDELLSA